MPRKNKQMPLINMEKTGRKIQSLMDEKGFSISDIQAVLIISSHQSIYSWFNGKTMPSIDNFVALSRLLEISLDDLIVCNEDAQERIDQFKIKEEVRPFYTLSIEIQKLLKKKENLDIEELVELSKKTGISLEEISVIYKNHTL